MSIRLICVGDISFGDHFVCASYGVNSMLQKNPDYDIFKYVKHILMKGDIVFGNLETVLSEKKQNKFLVSSFIMRGKTEYIRYLRDAGFNVLNVANNHSLQHGIDAFKETIELLERNQISVVGKAQANGNNCIPTSIKIKGREIVFLGYGFEKDKYFKGTPLYAFAKESAIIEDIRSNKKENNILICSFHWGNEFIDYPSPNQVKFAKKCIDEGCDLIIGHHPHVINGIDEYNGKYIFYSLGNFVFDELWNPNCTESMIVDLEIKQQEIKINQLYPIKINKKYTPQINGNIDFKKRITYLNQKIKKYSSDNKKYIIDFFKFDKENRYMSWRYMIKNIFKYKPWFLAQIIFVTIKNKIKDKISRI